MAFWTGLDSKTKDPKRAFRFVLSIPKLSTTLPHWAVKKVTKPKFAVSELTHRYLNHTFYYPGKVEWNEVTATFVDPVAPDATGGLMALLSKIGYIIPKDAKAVKGTQLSTMDKGQALGALGSVIIRQIDGSGEELESWTLRQAWIKDFTFNELSYDSDELSTIDVVFRYDWATYFGIDPTTGRSTAVWK